MNTENTATSSARESHMVDKSNIVMKITEVYFAHPISKTADPSSACDVVLELVDEEGEKHRWRSEYSLSYGKPGTNNASKTFAEITVDSLSSIGWTNGHDLARLDEMIGRTIIASVKWYQGQNGKWYKNIYLGEVGPRKMDKNQAFSIIQAIAGARNGANTNNFGAPNAGMTPQHTPFGNAATAPSFNPFK